ncbi:hypothetical protein STRDD11_00123 [Streptococcus sp. DD11]|nr:hypothetical protein STRDD11_00123 [Streptococcus sp. DD11]
MSQPPYCILAKTLARQMAVDAVSFFNSCPENEKQGKYQPIILK